MASTILFKSTPHDPVDLEGLDHADIALVGLRHVKLQANFVNGTAATRMYFRCDQAAAAGGATVALLLPEGYLSAGGVEEFWIDPKSTETPYLHILLTDDAQAPQGGATGDYALLLVNQANPD